MPQRIHADGLRRATTDGGCLNPFNPNNLLLKKLCVYLRFPKYDRQCSPVPNSVAFPFSTLHFNWSQRCFHQHVMLFRCRWHDCPARLDSILPPLDSIIAPLDSILPGLDKHAKEVLTKIPVQYNSMQHSHVPLSVMPYFFGRNILFVREDHWGIITKYRLSITIRNPIIFNYLTFILLR